MAALAGILTVGKLGEFLLHMSPTSDRRRNGGLLILAGLVLMACAQNLFMLGLAWGFGNYFYNGLNRAELEKFRGFSDDD